jgi:hypothetical protein
MEVSTTGSGSLPLYIMTWKLQLLIAEQYNERIANHEQYMIAISYNLKASSMFPQECVGGPRMDPQSQHKSHKII